MNVVNLGRVVVEGVGLHSGVHARVVLIRRPGEVTVSRGSACRAIGDLRVAFTERATTIDSPRVGTVEHLFAALAGLGVREGIAIEVEGPELPFLDGGARAWCDVIDALSPRADASFVATPRLRIVRDGSVDVEGSRYEVARGDGTAVSVAIDFDDPRVARDAEWLGSENDFRARIAPARTFAFLRELDGLHARGLASHVAPEGVIVIAPDVIHVKGRPFTGDEPARHKLLDLIGDLYFYGGPPIGVVRATRPGHAATHAFVRAALEMGLLAHDAHDA